MRILFLTQIVPFPPDAGPKVKTWHVLRYLIERGHEVILATFVRDEERPHLKKLAEVCAEVHAVPIRRSRIADIGYLLRSNLTGRPFLIERDDLLAMRETIRQITTKAPVDVIHADQFTMTQFAYADPQLSHPLQHDGQRPYLIFDAHNAVWTIVERTRQNAPWFLKPVLALETSRVKRYEGHLVKAFDITLAVTDPDETALLEATHQAGNDPQLFRDRIAVIPIAVDCQALQPVERKSNSLNIVTLGTLHYPPNADGIRWFMREVFPLIQEKIPAATLTIIGKNPPKDFIQAAVHDPSITLTGYIPDLTPSLMDAAVMVVPVRAGGGMRVRILEAFARGMPVVTTTVGLEGIQAEPGEDVLVEDQPGLFAEAVIGLLSDPDVQKRLAQNGRALAEARYDWQVVLQQLDRIYDIPVTTKAN
jgi:polysaccharide biosynthesis protein PslH